MIMIRQFSAIKVDSVNYQGVDLSRLCPYYVGKVLTEPLEKFWKNGLKSKKVATWILKVAT